LFVKRNQKPSGYEKPIKSQLRTFRQILKYFEAWKELFNFSPHFVFLIDCINMHFQIILLGFSLIMIVKRLALKVWLSTSIVLAGFWTQNSPFGNHHQIKLWNSNWISGNPLTPVCHKIHKKIILDRIWSAWHD